MLKKLLFLMILLGSTQVFADVGTFSFYGRVGGTAASDYYGSCSNVSAQDYQTSQGYIMLVSDGLWDNGAACRRVYNIRCLSTPNSKKACTSNTIRAMVVGLCPNGNCAAGKQKNITMLIAAPRYSSLVRSRDALYANVEFARYN